MNGAPGTTLRSALEVVSIAEVERERDALGARCFGDEELLALSKRRAQTTAGFLAAKRALVRLFAEPGRPPLGEKDFVLTHKPSGAPHLASLPPALQALGRVRVSISHTRAYAYGLAVLERGPRG